MNINKKVVNEMKCDICDTYNDKNSKYCSNCGNKLKSHKISNFFAKFTLLMLLIVGTEFTIITKNKISISIWIIFIYFLLKTIISNKLIYYFTDYRKPNIKLLNKLFDLKILNQNDLFTIEYVRLKKGWESIFNDGKGLIIECQDNPPKNEIQQNFINHMKNRD